ncbi:hypothetical protein BDV23DRAFT_167707 [Aspergillus alliaceus]|uniref:C2H2-type domain-containing protein n=1 Tax=Petromyces alliaceus TaxID=209559 RepID=A0A5N7BQC8_PETAA|nr:hypothetical protein BDV23DRAFT_167707 [Aspergillus alliaceus]
MLLNLPIFLIYISDWSLLVCTIHQTAIHPSKAQDHLAAHYLNQSYYTDQINALHLPTIQHIHQAMRAREPIAPIETLAPPMPAYQCRVHGCHTLALTRRKLNHHLSRIHRQFGTANQACYQQSCWVQTLDHLRYIFRVHQPMDSPPQSLIQTQIATSPDPDQLASQFLHSHRALEQHLATKRVFRVYGTPDEANSFHLET